MLGFLGLDHRQLPPLVALELFFDALHEGRQVILRVKQERKAREEYAHRLEQDPDKAQAARRKAVEAEYARLLLRRIGERPKRRDARQSARNLRVCFKKICARH